MNMPKVLSTICLVLLAISVLKADRYTKILELIHDAEYEKAEEQIQKLLSKRDKEPSAKYLYSQLFFAEGFARRDLDSAYFFVKSAVNDHRSLIGKELESFEKGEIDINKIESFILEIEKVAYQEVVKNITLQGLLHYTEHFKASAYVRRANEQIDSLRFQAVSETNTWESYQYFMEEYPTAQQFDEAQKRFDKLVYEDLGTGDDLNQLEHFVKKYPTNPFREKVEHQILIKSTKDGSLDSFLQFITKYDRGAAHEQALSVLFYLDWDFHDLSNFRRYALTKSTKDSLGLLIRQSRDSLFAVLERGKYGFVDLTGNLIVEPTYLNVDPNYLCGFSAEKTAIVTIQDNTQRQQKVLLNRHSEIMMQEGFDQASSLGGGFVRVMKNGKYGVVHEMGNTILPFVYEDIELINRQFFKVKKANKFGLFTMMGLEIAPISFEEITSMHNVYAFTKGGKIGLVKASEFLANPASLDQLAHDFEEVETFGRELIVVYHGDREGLLSITDLKPRVHLDDHRIKTLPNGWVVESKQEIRFHLPDIEYNTSHNFVGYESNERWLSVKRDSVWDLIDFKTSSGLFEGLDSIRIISEHFIYVKTDSSQFIYTSMDSIISLDLKDHPRLLPTENCTMPLLRIDAKTKSIYDAYGFKHLSGAYDDIRCVGDSLFVVEKSNKKGLRKSGNKRLLVEAFEGIQYMAPGKLQVLQKGRFRIFSLKTGKLSIDFFDSRIRKYSENLFMANIKGKDFVINEHGKKITQRGFDEIYSWTDSLGLVRENDQWGLYALKWDVFSIPDITSFETEYERNDHKRIKVITKDGYGIVDTEKGVIIPPKYSDVFNIAGEAHPIYFVEKSIPEAKYYVTMLTDENGKTLRSFAYRETEYERVLCEQRD